MSDGLDYLAQVVIVIREDVQLLEVFNKILGANLGNQRVPLLHRELEQIQAPEVVMKFIRLLSDERIASLVHTEINRA
ncbi:MAG: hypothetical protein AB7F86_19985 [Bdellovibrionales bacterium]